MRQTLQLGAQTGAFVLVRYDSVKFLTSLKFRF